MPNITKIKCSDNKVLLVGSRITDLIKSHLKRVAGRIQDQEDLIIVCSSIYNDNWERWTTDAKAWFCATLCNVFSRLIHDEDAVFGALAAEGVTLSRDALADVYFPSEVERVEHTLDFTFLKRDLNDSMVVA